MGTNYYLHEKPPCEHCGRSDVPLHIGKSSGGWCFALRVYPSVGLNILGDWMHLLTAQSARIVDEYGDRVEPAKMVAIITTRSWPDRKWDADDWQRFYEAGSERGPNGLMRARVGFGRCVGHGEGTWDYVEGEFS